jgi:hypothetical protein
VIPPNICTFSFTIHFHLVVLFHESEGKNKRKKKCFEKGEALEAGSARGGGMLGACASDLFPVSCPELVSVGAA